MDNQRSYCQGCGSLFQSADENLSGYINNSILNSNKEILCQRCFNIRHYNKINKININNNDFYKTFEIIKQTNNNSLIVYIIDIFDFWGSYNEKILEELSLNKSILLVFNKIDLLPKNINYEHLLKWVKSIIKDKYNHILDYIFISSTKNININQLINIINKYYNKCDIYFVGYVNVGKSSLLNIILNILHNQKKEIITVSKFLATTLDLIKFNWGNFYLIDTPGLINENSYLSYLETDLIKKIMPEKRIKPITMQAKKNISIYLGAIGRIDFFIKEITSFTFYLSNAIKLHNCNINDDDETFIRLRKNILSPQSEKIISLNDLVKKEITLKNRNKIDINFPGLGNLCLNNPNLEKIILYIPKEIKITISEAKI